MATSRPSRAQFRVEHVARKPRGWRVRTRLEGAHRIRIAFPPGPRRKGAGEVVEILHPKGERNPDCKVNPAELVIFGNPTYIDRAQRKWESLSRTDRESLLTQLGAGKQWARSFDVYGDMPQSVSEKLVRHFAAENPTVPEQHQIKIAKQTLKMADAMLGVMGGMTKEQAREILRRHGIRFKENPKRRRNIISEVPDPRSPGEMKFAPWRVNMLKFISSHWYGGSLSNSELRQIQRITHMPSDVVDWSFIRDAEDDEVRDVYDLVKSKHPQEGSHRGFNPRPSKSGWAFTPGTSRVMLRAKDKKLHTVSRGLSRRDAKRFAVELRGVAKRGQTGEKYFVRNPDAGEEQKAVQLFQQFHGRDPKGIVEKHVSDAMRREYTALGALDYIIFRTDSGAKVTLDFEGDGVTLASSPAANQLYFIGGNQNISSCLGKFVEDDSKDFIDLGEAVEVQYLARKAQGNFEPVKYFHKFGEQHRGSELPRGVYDKIRRQIFLAGGEYTIEAPGIVN